MFREVQPLSQQHRPADEGRRYALLAQALCSTHDGEGRLAGSSTWARPRSRPWVCSGQRVPMMQNGITPTGMPAGTGGSSTGGFAFRVCFWLFRVFARVGGAGRWDLRDLPSVTAAVRRLALPLHLSAEAPGRLLATAVHPLHPLEAPTPAQEVAQAPARAPAQASVPAPAVGLVQVQAAVLSTGSGFGSSTATGGTVTTNAPGTTGSSGAFGTPGATFGGAPIVGVGLQDKKTSIKIYRKQTHYNQWEFVYDPSQNAIEATAGVSHEHERQHHRNRCERDYRDRLRIQ